MKLFSVIGYYDDGYSYRGPKEVWTVAENSQAAADKVTLFYNAQYDAVFSPRATVEIDGKNMIFDSVAKS